MIVYGWDREDVFACRVGKSARDVQRSIPGAILLAMLGMSSVCVFVTPMSHVYLAQWLEDNDHSIIPREFKSTWSSWPTLAFKYKICIVNWPPSVKTAPSMPNFRWKMNQDLLDFFWAMMLDNFEEDCTRAIDVNAKGRDGALNQALYPADVPLFAIEGWTEGSCCLAAQSL